MYIHQLLITTSLAFIALAQPVLQHNEIDSRSDAAHCTPVQNTLCGTPELSGSQDGHESGMAAGQMVNLNINTKPGNEDPYYKTVTVELNEPHPLGMKASSISFDEGALEMGFKFKEVKCQAFSDQNGAHALGNKFKAGTPLVLGGDGKALVMVGSVLCKNKS